MRDHCKHCGNRLYGLGEGGECYACRMKEKCPNCTKPVSVSNGVRFCSHCDPIRFGVTSQTATGEKELLHEGTSETQAESEFWELVRNHADHGMGRKTFTIWRQTYYGPATSGTRCLEKETELTVQSQFKGGSQYMRDYTEYTDQTDRFRFDHIPPSSEE